MKLSIVAALALVGCSASPSKQDIATAPFDIEQLEAKEDSPTKPSKGVDVRIAERAQDKFTASRGFIAHRINLTGGRVDLDVSGTENGDQLDTILYVFGPKKANGKFPTRALAFNDDFEPGVNFGSHIILDVPAAGEYQIVVSTYDNYVSFPSHVSRGDYQLMVKCQSETFGACGPAVSGVDGQCWEDSECVAADGAPLHCEGEVTCAPGTQCFFVRMGVCVEDYVWMTYSAKQCTNPWSAAEVTEDEAAAFPVGDLAQVMKHYGKQGVSFDEVGQLTPQETMFQCLACGCARGDQIVVKVKSTSSDVLAADGWIFSAPSPEAVSLEPAQCGSNPWQTAPTSSVAEELEQVDVWLAAEGATLTKRGFTYPTERKVTCASCDCARGDRLIAFPADQQDAGFLSSLGFSAVYVP
ncbi:MAG: hypothetical protein H0V17_36220 [Deltaproteobacteria bacterium]|nr:hypothetical protein [Deltaproteobacteria bacterium]